MTSKPVHHSIEEAEQQGKYIRRIRSFVKREGRLTKGQAGALERQWPTMGLAHAEGKIDLVEVFGNTNPVTLEVGFGMGKSLVEMAAKASTDNFIGIEVHTPGVGACLLEAEQNKVNNLRVYEHDAVEIFQDCIEDDSLAKVQLFFPDPWHKKRHHKRRIVQPEFVELVMRKLQVGGIFHLATDWENYAEHMVEVLNGFADLENLSANNDYIPRPESRPLTKFEQRGQRLGHGVWDLQYRRFR